MKKQIVALLVAILMVLTTMNAFAEETDTDYSYLEDMSVKELMSANPNLNPRKLQIGQQIRIPKYS